MESNTNNKIKPTEMVRYPLASAGRRIGSKILDILIVGVVVLGIGLAIFLTNPDGTEVGQIQPWRYGVFSLCMMLLFAGLLLVLPSFTSWTLGMKICKLKYVKVLPLKNLGLCIFKHELFTWEIFVLLSLVTGVTLTFLNPEQSVSLFAGIVPSIHLPDGFVVDNVLKGVGIFFACLYYVSIVLLIVILIGVCIKSKRPAFHDKYSDLLVVHLVPIKDLDKNANLKKKKTKRINYGIPGEINSGSFEELDELE